MRTVFSLSALGLIGLVGLLACGGAPAKAPAPPTPPTEATEASTATDPKTLADPAASQASAVDASAPATEATPTASDGPPAAAGSTGSSIAEGHDACAGVAAPFEEKVRAKFNECYQAGKKKNPELAGTIKVTLKVNVNGKVKYVQGASKLDAKVLACMLNAVKKEPFDAKACQGKDVAVSKTFGAR